MFQEGPQRQYADGGILGSMRKGRTSDKATVHIEKQERNCGAGYAAMQEILRQEERPTAIFSASNEQALGIVIACREGGGSYPGGHGTDCIWRQ